LEIADGRCGIRLKRQRGVDPHLVNGQKYSSSAEPYRFGGKEQETMFGLDLYDFHARQMDSRVGSFLTVDPLAEIYYSISPYAYCAGNPVKYIDPTGMSYTYNWGTGEYLDEDGNVTPWGFVYNSIINGANKISNGAKHIADGVSKFANQASSFAQDFTVTMEFATGTGKEYRTFTREDISTISLKDSYLTTVALKKFMKDYNQKGVTKWGQTITFSPFSSAEVGPFNSLLHDKGYSTAQFTGSCDYSIEAIGNQLNVTVMNRTSLWSALYHILGVGTPSREQAFLGIGGNVHQTYRFTISLDEAKQRTK
jgi:RHS repeat-associated protein